MIRKIINGYWEFIWLYKKEAIIALISSIIGALSEAYAIYTLVSLITKLKDSSDKIINSNIDESSILYINNYTNSLTLFIVFAVIASILFFISQRFVIKIKSQVEKYIRGKTTDALMKMEWVHFIKLSQGDLAKSIITEGQQIAEGCMFVISGATYFCIAATYFLVSLYLVRNSLIILIIYSVFAINIYQRFARRAEYLGRNLSSMTSYIGKSSSGIFNNLKYIRINNLNDYAKEDSYRIFMKFAQSYEKALTSGYLTKSIMQILSALFILVVLIYIIFSRSSNYSLLLSLALFIRMSPNIYNLQYRLLDAAAIISWPNSYRERINNAIKHEEIESISNQENIDLCGEIKFDSVDFSYPNSNKVLNELDLIIKEKSMVSIIGNSGAGKSTISDLLTGLIRPVKGSIIVGGKALSTININNWRSRLGIVMQENYFANESIAYNVALGTKDLNEKKIIYCLKVANAWEFIKSLPNGIYESVMERGSRFSVGQRQRIALARALYRDPQLLILDEPTSSLDKNSEEHVLKTLKMLKGKLTILLITHKPYMAIESDNIYILEKGKISNQGNWKELHSDLNIIK